MVHGWNAECSLLCTAGSRQDSIWEKPCPIFPFPGVPSACLLPVLKSAPFSFGFLCICSFNNSPCLCPSNRRLKSKRIVGNKCRSQSNLYNIPGYRSVCVFGGSSALGAFLFHSFSPFKSREVPTITVVLLQI